MKTFSIPRFAVFGALLVGAAAIRADEPSLGVGDPTPKLQVGKWVQGEPVKGYDKDKYYLVEFWATWCGPCRESIPHLNEIHNKYQDKGLVVIGQDVWESNESLVEPFIKKMGDKMTYRVALDDKSSASKGAMSENWMAAAGQRGIPTAFIVNKQGTIAWIGHPMMLTEAMVDKVMSPEFDLKQAAKDFADARASEEEMDKLFGRFRQAIDKKDWNAAESALADLENASEAKGRYDRQRLTIALGRGDFGAAANLAEKMGDASPKEPMVQNDLAWALVTQEGIKGRALEVAARCADRANEATKGKDAAILDTVARVRFLQGKPDEAIELETKAVTLAEGDLKSQLEAALKSYKEGKLPQAD